MSNVTKKLDNWYAYFTCANSYSGLSQRFFLLTEKVKCSQKRAFMFANMALTSPTSGGRSVGIVRLRTKGHGVIIIIIISYCHVLQ
jgi:hypothetical protein